MMEELKIIMEKFAASGWDLIALPARQWLNGEGNKNNLIAAVSAAGSQCGSCGCDLDLLYKRAPELL